MQNGGELHIYKTARQKLGAGCEGDKKRAMHTTAEADGVPVLPKGEGKGKKTIYVSKCKTWKLKVEETQKEFEQNVCDREA